MKKCMRDRSGMTLIELMVATVLTVLVGAMVYTAFTAVSRQTTLQRKKLTLTIEANRIAQSVYSRVANSRRLVEWNNSSIVCLRSPGDTLNYSFYYNELRLNDTPVVVTVPGMYVDAFSIDHIEQGVGLAGDMALMEISLSLTDRDGRKSMVSRLAAVSGNP